MEHHPRRAAVACALAIAALLIAAAGASAEKYVALGDSYSSGTGTRVYTDAGCQRSIYAYPSLIDTQRPNTDLVFAACSGATTNSVLSGQVSSLTSDTAIVTITIGGNDAGFSSVVTQCALPWPWSCTTDLNNAQAFIRNTLPGRLDSVYAQIRTRSPSARVVVLGYPRLFMGVDCNGGTFFSGDELTRMNQTADMLRDVTRGRAAAAGFSFADAIPAFTGHAVCSSTEWLNGLSNPVGESYHPNRTGHSSGYAPLVRAIIG
ncbi:SGNH/GDSL hydrolase family protein [Conexibacter woesei]|uniref:Triacylglycerol lipase n=1 Tax=Conexibacter woesei (strain DSM 14684 / CCUG 47730 / CIP 108061 / JCM 11494 / NBRC 100937 / ID131577) TaxID=469383 RepID=D3FC90_CONWI|nr:SGNH/GDSL hydrolase family protein [Conexibacter woesei]ADB53385.1 Triacylglycerol lipase [Conexibacter woesei DSM 14684]